MASSSANSLKCFFRDLELLLRKAVASEDQACGIVLASEGGSVLDHLTFALTWRFPVWGQ